MAFAVEKLVEGVLRSDRRAIARAISLVEDDGEQARALLSALYPHTGQAYLIGVTGAPGTGKSTLVNALAKLYRQRGARVGILAVDPSSPFTGGALLGDRVRMTDLTGDPGIFIRSMATRGALGGLAFATNDALHVLDAAGFDPILIETVGIGQDEVEIARVAHSVLLVEAPGLGDDVQAFKAGVMEIADLFVVNKADQDGVERTVAALESMLELAYDQGNPDGWRPPVIRTVALRSEGVEELLAALDRHRDHMRSGGRWRARERLRVETILSRMLQQTALEQVQRTLGEEEWEALVERAVDRQVSLYAAFNEIVERVWGKR